MSWLETILGWFYPAKWLRVRDPITKRDQLAFIIAEALDQAQRDQMPLEDLWIFFRRRSWGVSLILHAPGVAGVIAVVKPWNLPSFRLAWDSIRARASSLADEAVEKAMDDLAQEVLRQVYGEHYVRRLRSPA